MNKWVVVRYDKNADSSGTEPAEVELVHGPFPNHLAAMVWGRHTAGLYLA